MDAEGFEPSKAEPADLQSAHFDRLYTHPKTFHHTLKSGGVPIRNLKSQLGLVNKLVETEGIRTFTARGVRFTVGWAHSCPASPLIGGKRRYRTGLLGFSIRC